MAHGRNRLLDEAAPAAIRHPDWSMDRRADGVRRRGVIVIGGAFVVAAAAAGT